MNHTIKLPPTASNAVFTEQGRKFALVAALALVEIGDLDENCGILFRPGEMNVISHTPEAETPIHCDVTLLDPVLVPAIDASDAASALTDFVKTGLASLLERQPGEPPVFANEGAGSPGVVDQA